MDKQQAITYIHQMLDQDATREEIVRGLVDQLHAPEAIVTKFVTQTEAEYRKNEPQPSHEPVPPQPVKLPPWLEEMSVGAQSIQPTTQPDAPQPDWMQRLADGAAIPGSAAAADIEEPLPDWVQASSPPATPYLPPSTPASQSWENEAQAFVFAQLQYGRLHSDIADELADRVGITQGQAESFVTVIASQVHIPSPQKITNTAEAAEFIITEHAKGRARLEIAAELATRTGEPQNLTEKFVSLTITKFEKSSAQEEPPSPRKPPVDLNKPALVKYVVGEFARNRKRNDIVITICERTGVHWSEAQRFVGQVYAQQHATINARKNRLIIPMCIGAVVLGFVFTIGTVYPMVYFFTRRWGEFISITQSMGSISDLINAAPYIFLTGIAMIGGGIIGLIMAMRSQME